MKEATLTLYELNRQVREAIACEMADEYWVEAELSECHENRGHCYMELIQKDEQSNTPVARASAKCWASQWALVGRHFERVTGQRMQTGMKVLLKVYPQFHEAYGFSWIVTDVDPTYTMGDLTRRRQQIIAQLKDEGVFDLQRDLQLPLFCQRIAVISSETAAGYGDFAGQLTDAPFRFSTRLFPATMQGEQVEQSIIAALNRIYDAIDDFDCVVIIRGGGATSDLSGFDTLALAENVAQFPLPIITGIGHDRDESVLDMVSHLRVKTPTAAAAFLIDHLQEVASRIEEAQNRLVTNIDRCIKREQLRLTTLASRIPTATMATLNRQQLRLGRLQERITIGTPARLQEARHRLELLSQRVQALDPALLLQRGYSITLHNGRALRSADDVKPGDVIETRLQEGTIQSTII